MVLQFQRTNMEHHRQVMLLHQLILRPSVTRRWWSILVVGHGHNRSRQVAMDRLRYVLLLRSIEVSHRTPRLRVWSIGSRTEIVTSSLCQDTRRPDVVANTTMQRSHFVVFALQTTWSSNKRCWVASMANRLGWSVCSVASRPHTVRLRMCARRVRQRVALTD